MGPCACVVGAGFCAAADGKEIAADAASDRGTYRSPTGRLGQGAPSFGLTAAAKSGLTEPDVGRNGRSTAGGAQTLENHVPHRRGQVGRAGLLDRPPPGRGAACASRGSVIQVCSCGRLVRAVR